MQSGTISFDQIELLPKGRIQQFRHSSLSLWPKACPRRRAEGLSRAAVPSSASPPTLKQEEWGALESVAAAAREEDKVIVGMKKRRGLEQSAHLPVLVRFEAVQYHPPFPPMMRGPVPRPGGELVSVTFAESYGETIVSSSTPLLFQTLIRNSSFFQAVVQKAGRK